MPFPGRRPGPCRQVVQPRGPVRCGCRPVDREPVCSGMVCSGMVWSGHASPWPCITMAVHRQAIRRDQGRSNAPGALVQILTGEARPRDGSGFVRNPRNGTTTIAVFAVGARASDRRGASRRPPARTPRAISPAQNLPRTPTITVRPGSYCVNVAFGNWK